MHLFLSTKKSRYSIWRSELHERHKLLLKTGVDSFTGHPVYLALADPAGVCVCGGLAVVSTSCCQQKPAAALSGYIELSPAITNPSPPIHSLRPPANPYPTLHLNNIISLLQLFNRKTILIMEDFSVLDSLNQKITISNIEITSLIKLHQMQSYHQVLSSSHTNCWQDPSSRPTLAARRSLVFTSFDSSLLDIRLKRTLNIV